jgi:amidophosphoribosyltransferase
VVLDQKGIRSRIAVEGRRRALCVFEHIYFARPDSRLDGRCCRSRAGGWGEILAREAPVDADLVIPCPTRATRRARVRAGSGLPQDDGLIKNRYVARTFIQPGQQLRKHGLRLKFNPLPEVVGGKRLVVVDDSIVRGNTTRQIVRMLRDAGAREVHMRISAPADPQSLPLRRRHVDARGDGRPRAHGSRGGRRARAATRSPTSRWRRSTRRSAGRARRTATRASRATTRSRRPAAQAKDAFEHALPLARL